VSILFSVFFNHEKVVFCVNIKSSRALLPSADVSKLETANHVHPVEGKRPENAEFASLDVHRPKN